MKDTKFYTSIVLITDNAIKGQLTALRGGLNEPREDKEVQLNDKFTGYMLKEFKLNT
jgi:hypothetical protein